MRASPSALSHSPTGPLPAAGSPLGSAMVVWPPTPPLAVLDGFLHFPFPESYPPLPFPGCAFPAPPEMRPPRSSSSSPPSSSSLSSSPPAPPSSPRSISIAALSSSSTPWGSFEVVLIAHGETSRDLCGGGGGGEECKYGENWSGKKKHHWYFRIGARALSGASGVGVRPSLSRVWIGFSSRPFLQWDTRTLGVFLYVSRCR